MLGAVNEAVKFPEASVETVATVIPVAVLYTLMVCAPMPVVPASALLSFPVAETGPFTITDAGRLKVRLVDTLMSACMIADTLPP